VQDRGWNQAEVTTSRVPVEKINFCTMESRLVPALYLVGEFLNCDGRNGGFNFHWAWVTRFLVGQAVGRTM